MENFLDFIGLQKFYIKLKADLKSMFALKDEIKNVQSDWNTTDINSSTYIKNKPDLSLEIVATDSPENLQEGDFWLSSY